MKKEYQKPAVEITVIEIEDIIAASNLGTMSDFISDSIGLSGALSNNSNT